MGHPVKEKLNKMPRVIKYFGCLLVLISLISCNQKSRLTDISEVEEQDDETPVNVIEQAMPTIMVIPSDQSLKGSKAATIEIIDGAEYIKRDYLKYLLENRDNKALMRFIQDKFIQMDFPLSDLEQSLKNLNNLETSNEVNGLATDAKTMLLATVNPDYILELDYSFGFGRNIMNHNKELNCILSIIDPTTEKVLSSTTLQGSGKEINEALASINPKDFDALSNNLKNEFTKTIKKGREITVRVTVDKNSGILLTDRLSNGETLSDYIIDYLDDNTKKGTYSLQRNSGNELYFTNVRISNLNANGRQTNAYKWGRDLCRSLREDLGVQATNNSQKLNEVHITIE